MPVLVKNPVVKNNIKKALKPPISDMLKAVQQDKRDAADLRGWNTISANIDTKKDTDHSGRIFVNNKNYKGTNTPHNMIAGFQHYGTPAHGPVKAKFLRFIIDGKIIFTKWVKGIKATNWWGLKDTGKEKVREILRKYFG